jgi:hypothetical protein
MIEPFSRLVSGRLHTLERTQPVAKTVSTGTGFPVSYSAPYRWLTQGMPYLPTPETNLNCCAHLKELVSLAIANIVLITHVFPACTQALLSRYTMTAGVVATTAGANGVVSDLGVVVSDLAVPSVQNLWEFRSRQTGEAHLYHVSSGKVVASRAWDIGA